MPSLSSIAGNVANLTVDVPPGVPFLTRILIRLLLPLLLLKAAFLLLASLHPLIPFLGIFDRLPLYLSLPAYILVNPAHIFLRQACWDAYHAWDARRRGTVILKRWEGKKLFSLDLAKEMANAFENGYIAEGLWKGVEMCGGTWAFRVLFYDEFFTIEPEHIKTILATDFTSFEKGPEFHKIMKSVLGIGVFNSDGDLWKFHRSMTRPFFARDRISDYDNFERHAMKAIDVLTKRLRGGDAVDIQDALSRFTLDSATQFLFGTCVNSLDDDLPYPSTHSTSSAYPHRTPSPDPSPGTTSHSASNSSTAARFSAAFLAAQTAAIQRLRHGSLWELYELREDKTKKPMAEVRGLIEPVIQRALERKKMRAFQGMGGQGGMGAKGAGAKVEEVGEAETMLDHLVQLTDDPVMIRDETINILLAGRDTTASTLTFALYLMALYPHVFQKLRAEVVSRVGKVPNETGNGEKWRCPTTEDVREMKYLRAVINEVLRLYPAVPFNIRTAAKTTTLPPTEPGGRPIYVPKGTPISYSVFMMQRRTDLWGPDALEFDPDRWLDERLQKYVTPNPFIFLPFNAGPRICLGQQFALTSTSYMLIRLLQHFTSITLALDAQPPDSLALPHWKDVGGIQGREKLFAKTHLTNYVLKGCWVRMEIDEGKESREGTP